MKTVCGKSAARWVNFALGKNPQSGRIGGGHRPGAAFVGLFDASDSDSVPDSN
ncbi:hypothetical protein [Burkholderia ubonensis]|uniref:hypothetical protein n=1 Tax=Burkholderia ubonensis TaxID=101571 RepID=UPI0012FCA355|nr:hypothetical protein [Burkholderia ubonensis]